jgi:tetratricopeptide (TPR) repeat protein
MGACFSIGFAVAEPMFRALLVIIVLVWSVIGPFALSYFFIDLSTILSRIGKHKAALAIARLGVSVDNSLMPVVQLFGIHESPLAVINLMNEACALMCLCRFKEASEKFEIALDKSQAALGWDHNLTQIVVGQHASCLQYLGKFHESEQFFRRAIAANVVQLGPAEEENFEEHFPVVLVLALDRFGLGSLFEKQLKFDLAEAQYKQAIETIDKYVLDETDVLADNLNALGDLYVKTGRLEDAHTFINRALRIRKEIFPPMHIVVASSYHSLGSLRLKQGNLYEAKKYLNDALKIKERYLGKEHPDVADTYRASGELETALNNFAQAEDYLSRSLEILNQTYGDHPDVALVMESLSALYEKSGKNLDAEHFQKRAVEIRQTVK